MLPIKKLRAQSNLLLWTLLALLVTGVINPQFGKIFVIVFFACLYVALIGGGWALFLRFRFNLQITSLAVAFIAFSVIWSLATIWTFSFGIDFLVTRIVVLVLSLAGWLASFYSWKRGNFVNSERNQIGQRNNLILLVMATIISLSALLPQISERGELNVSTRIGPDAIGYATAARYLSDDKSIEFLRSEALSQLPEGTTLEQSLMASEQQILLIPSRSTQFATEFLIGAKRWLVPSSVAGLATLNQSLSVWQIQATLTSLALFSLLMLVPWLFRARDAKDIVLMTAAMASLGLNPQVLNAWHEGGIGQIWAMPIVGLAAAVLLRKEGSNSLLIAIVWATVFVTLVPNYFDAAVFVYAGSVLTVFMIYRRRGGESRRITVKPFFVGTALGALVSIPILGNIIPNVVARFGDTGQAGWEQPLWATPADIFGLANMYVIPYGQYQPRSFLASTMVAAISALVIIMAIVLIRTQRFDASKVVLVWAITYVLLVYVVTGVLLQSTSYAFFKAIVMSLPWLIFGLLYLLLTKIKFDATLQKRVLVSAGSLWIAVAAFASFDWQKEWRAQSTFFSSSLSELRLNEQYQDVLGTYDILSVSNVQTMVLGESGDFRWVNWKDTLGNSPYISNPSRPLALLLYPEYDCQNWKCLNGIKRESIIFKTDSLAFVDLGASNAQIEKMSSNQRCVLARKQWLSLGGNHMKNCVPLNEDPMDVNESVALTP